MSYVESKVFALFFKGERGEGERERDKV